MPVLLVLGCSDPAPAVDYSQLVVPEARLASEDARRSGRELYLRHCALCHGERADGHGRRRHSLSTPPVDFTRPDWRARTTPKDLFRVVREGVRGTPMPAWRVFDDEQTWDLAAYLLAVSESGPEIGGPPVG